MEMEVRKFLILRKLRSSCLEERTGIQGGSALPVNPVPPLSRG
jgi:hypothetical protein